MEAKKPASVVATESFWDSFCDTYIAYSEPYNSPVGLQLALQTKADQARTVLEVACGSGYAALMISQFLKPGTSYCCLDQSGNMIRRFEQRFANSSFVSNPHNALVPAPPSPSPSPSAPASATDKDKEKDKVDPARSKAEGVSIRLYQGNNERLPFVDSAFDSYIAAGSLYVVDSPVAMVQEAYRVLKPGGLAGFGVFGKEKDSTYFGVVSEVMRKYAIKHNVKLPQHRSLFHLGEDEAAFLKMIQDAGFKNIKHWHQHCVFPLSVAEFMAEKNFTLPT